MTAGDVTFVTFDQTRHRVLTSSQMRDTEKAAIDSGAITGFSMMETAGRGVVDALMAADPAYASGKHHGLVLCGPGNNGGDGFVIALVLHKLGWTVDVYLFGNHDKLPPDAEGHAQRWLEVGEIMPIAKLTDAHTPQADVVFDALFGTGLERPLGPELICTLERIASNAKTVVAVDIPSGIHADTGQMLCCSPTNTRLDDQENAEPVGWPRADHIVTFQRMKPGHILAYLQPNTEPWDTQGNCTLSIVDLGIATFEPPLSQPSDKHGGVGPIYVSGAALNLHKQNRAHKYQHGHALVCAGGIGKGGAGRLAARAALRVGAGASTVCCPPEALQENAAQLNSVMLMSAKDHTEFENLLKDTRKNALCLGPGMGVDQRTRSFVLAALKTRRPMVLDADALTSFSAGPEVLFAELHQDVVLTPHIGEFTRLFPDLATQPETGPTQHDHPAEFSIIEATCVAAKRANCHVLLKGAVTIIAGPTGQVELSVALGDRSAPWLATAGSGDVLAGFLTGLLARGFAPLHAATAATWLHIECARAFGPGLIAEDLPDMLPSVLSQWEDDLKAGKFAT